MYTISINFFTQGHKINHVFSLRFCLLLAIILTNLFSPSLFAQKVNIQEKNATLSKIFNNIRSQTDYDFIISQSILDREDRITVNLSNIDLTEALKIIFKNRPYEFEIKDKSILVKIKTLTNTDNNLLTAGASQNIIQRVISGTVKDQATGESLIGAAVRVLDNTGQGTLTNDYGFYSLSLPEGTNSIQVSFVGYAPKVIAFSLHGDSTLNIFLSTKNDLEDIVVNSNTSDNQIRSPQMGQIKLNMNQLNMVPVLLGEKDVIKTMTLLPGIKSAGEGSTGFYVRGGASDQNLILLDEAPVYNAAHMLGFFSVFNSDAIKDASIYKGGIPAEYGGRLSSVLDIKMNEGNNQRFTVQGGLGLIASRLKMEGPIVKGKGVLYGQWQKNLCRYFP